MAKPLRLSPQAYVSRNALRMTVRFLLFLMFWRAALFFAAGPTAMLLDWWLGIDGISCLHQREVRSLAARRHERWRHRYQRSCGLGRTKQQGCRTVLDLTMLILVVVCYAMAIAYAEMCIIFSRL